MEGPGSSKYQHGGNTQEGRENSAREAATRLRNDQVERRTELVAKIGNGINAKELMELQDLMMQTQGNMPEAERQEIWNKIQGK